MLHLRRIHKQHGRQDPPDPDARKSTDRPSEQRLHRETCRGNVEYRSPGIPHLNVEKVDTNRKETVNRLIRQFENHPNRDWLLQEFNKTEEINPFSEESKDFITIWATRKSSSSTRPLRRNNARIAPFIGKLASYTAHAANACSLQKGIDR